MRALQRRSAGTARKPSGKPRGAPAAARPVNPARLAVARAYLAFLNGGARAEAPPRNLLGEADRRLFAELLRGMVRHQLLLEAEL
ncbi:MAG: hypothetical protein O7E56_01095, partial [SAR324 cluster bacterium]|nr:hypothetical protein [SAR324 cluster bacterium]